MANQISEVMRRTLFDVLRIGPWHWWGRLVRPTS
jgi:hypothetical protein